MDWIEQQVVEQTVEPVEQTVEPVEQPVEQLVEHSVEFDQVPTPPTSSTFPSRPLRLGYTLVLLLTVVVASYAWILVQRRPSELVFKPPQSLAASAVTKSQSKTVFEKRQQIFKWLSSDLNALFNGKLLVEHIVPVIKQQRVVGVLTTLASQIKTALRWACPGDRVEMAAGTE